MQRLLRTADGDIEGVRDDVRDYALNHLGDLVTGVFPRPCLDQGPGVDRPRASHWRRRRQFQARACHYRRRGHPRPT
jgi:hypothetical protein